MSEPSFMKLLIDIIDWQRETFGPAQRHVHGILDHMEKEIKNELRAEPFDLKEWIDLLFLALNGATVAIGRHATAPSYYATAIVEEIKEALWEKFEENKKRTWPDWRTADPNKAIEHVRVPDGLKHEPVEAAPILCEQIVAYDKGQPIRCDRWVRFVFMAGGTQLKRDYKSGPPVYRIESITPFVGICRDHWLDLSPEEQAQWEPFQQP